MSAREKIEKILDNAYDRGFAHGRDYTDGGFDPDSPDDIIAIVREEMLSPTAVQSAHTESSVEVFTPAGANVFDYTAVLANPDGVIRAALDATFGAVEPTGYIVDGDTGVKASKD